jgi:hypothetical protein
VLAAGGRPRRPPPDAIRWADLSERGVWILRTIAAPVAAGCSYVEISAATGLRRQEVADLLDELALEIAGPLSEPRSR